MYAGEDLVVGLCFKTRLDLFAAFAGGLDELLEDFRNGFLIVAKDVFQERNIYGRKFILLDQ